MSETTTQDLDALREGLRLVEDVYRPALWRPGHEPGHTDLTPEECRLCAMDRALSAVAAVVRRELEAAAAGEDVRDRVAREIREAAWADPTGLRERQNAEALADRILALLRTPRGEGEAARRDGAQGEVWPRTSWGWMDYLECLLEDHVGAHDPATCCSVDDDEECCTTCALYRLHQRRPWRAAHPTDRSESDGA